VCEGTGTTFTVASTGTGVTYQWQEDSGSGFVNLSATPPYSGVTGLTLTIADVIGLGGYRYRAVATGTCSVVSSTAATSTERKKPVVTVPPVASIICEGNNTNFGGGYIEHASEQYTFLGSGRATTTDDFGSIVLVSKNGTPVLVRDVANVRIGPAPPEGRPCEMAKPSPVW